MAKKRKQKKTINNIVANKEFLSDFFSGALYGSAWFAAGVHKDTPTEIYQNAKLCNECAEDIWADVIINGGFVLIEDVEDKVDHKIDLKAIIKGFKTFMLEDPRHYAEVMLEEADIYGYDALLQFILFGSVIYG